MDLLVCRQRSRHQAALHLGRREPEFVRAVQAVTAYMRPTILSIAHAPRRPRPEKREAEEIETVRPFSLLLLQDTTASGKTFYLLVVRTRVPITCSYSY